MNNKISSIQFYSTTFKRIYYCAIKALPTALRTARWLLSIMIPISLGVTILQLLGVIEWAAFYLNPLFKHIGLSGQCALVFITSILLNIYSAIAVISTLPLTLREITILAIMCLIAHNLIIESLVQKKTGSSGIKMVVIRLVTSIFGAVVLNLLLPAEKNSVIYQSITCSQHLPLAIVFKQWTISTIFLSLKVIVFISALMILQKIMEEFGFFSYLSTILSPFLKIMGLPPACSFLWIVANLVGLGYGAAIMFEQLNKNKISRAETDLLNHHIAVSHSLLEDTLLFVAIGVSFLWITIPRLIFAIIIVWGYRLLLLKGWAKSSSSNQKVS
jgi:hypothetical protein